MWYFLERVFLSVMARVLFLNSHGHKYETSLAGSAGDDTWLVVALTCKGGHGKNKPQINIVPLLQLRCSRWVLYLAQRSTNNTLPVDATRVKLPAPNDVQKPRGREKQNSESCLNAVTGVIHRLLAANIWLFFLYKNTTNFISSVGISPVETSNELIHTMDQPASQTIPKQHTAMFPSC